MSRSSKWQFNLWPLDMRLEVRLLDLSEATPVADPAPGEAARRALPGGEPESVSLPPAPERSILDWEAEGGSLGPS